MKIKILDPLVANQIAAGEVIERPASIVKECLENSLDAGANQLSIEIAQGGMQLIRIIDDGHGIAKDDLSNAIKRHGTSKIASTADLAAISTLGFRGEALASIAAVAKVTLASSIAGEPHGWQLIAEGTETNVLEAPIAHPVGTSITVRDLFFNTPARRRFVRTEKTEFFHIEEVVKRIALSHFNLTIRLAHNQRMIYQLSGATTDILQDKRVAQLCGKEFMDTAIKIDIHATDLRLWGWIAQPNFSRNQGDLQYLYINGRMVRDKLLNHAIRQAYQQYFTHDQYPAYVLFLECDPSTVDVNVHPTKHEVRFHQSRLIHDFVVSSLRKALEADSGKKAQINFDQDQPKSMMPSYQKIIPTASTFTVAEQSAAYTELYNSTTASDISAKLTLGDPVIVMVEKFLITKHLDQLGIVHLQHAHEILFNKAFIKQTIPSKPLLFPLTVNLAERSLKNILSYAEQLNALGFDFELLGEKQLILRQTPNILERIDFEKFIIQLAENSIKNSDVKNIIKLVANTAASCLRSLENKAVQEKLLYNLQTQCDEAELNRCYQILDMQQLAQLFKRNLSE